jgi:hypothetical protein
LALRLQAVVAFYVLFHSALPASGQVPDAAKEGPPIQDNSFLIEEAYNQERGVVQHISTFSRMWNSKDWNYTFTQEWPGPHNWRHQFSYTLTGTHAGGFAGTGAGLGDTAFHYRYQVYGDGNTRWAFAPRVSMLLPSGDVTQGRSLGGVGIQMNLPVSVVLHRRVVSHWNAGSTLVPHAQSADHCRAATVGYNLGQSFIFVAHPRINFLLETAYSRFQSVVSRGRTEWSEATYLSPGVRWAYNFKSGLQIIPGVAMPIGVGESAGERGVFLYLSFEHPFGKLNAR